jgi:hypothetical protein
MYVYCLTMSHTLSRSRETGVIEKPLRVATLFNDIHCVITLPAAAALGTFDLIVVLAREACNLNLILILDP